MKEKLVYSDGDIETIILQAINNPKAVTQLCSTAGAAFHNFTKCRENLINWYPFKKSASVLEIGAGMGAITGCLCEKCSKVLAIEESPRRAQIIRERHKKFSNLEVISDDIYTHSFEEKFDYILLIGVLEYVGINRAQENPYVKLLAKINELLSENGILLLAIENKYGLKYWCGAPEDHTGVPFEGLNNYEGGNITGRYGKAGVRTFSKQELSDMFQEAGFQDERFYYPLPDYKFPSAIFTDKHMPTKDDLRAIKFYYSEESELIADERMIYEDIVNNGVFSFFSNSFLCEVSKSKLEDNCIEFVSHKRDYIDCYNISTIIYNNKVHKYANTELAYKHLEKCQNNIEELSRKGIPVVMSSLTDDKIMTMPYMSCPLAINIFNKELINGNINKLIIMLNKLKHYLLNSSDVHMGEPCTIKGYNSTGDVVLNEGFVDMTFINSFYKEGDYVFFDQEWKIPNIPIKYILYRAIKYSNYKESQHESVIFQLYKEFDIFEQQIQSFEKYESELLSNMMDKNNCNVFDAMMYHEGLTIYPRARRKIKDLCNEIQQKNNEIEKRIQEISDKNRQIEFENKEIEQRNQEIDNKNQEIEQKNQEIEQKNQKIERKNQEIEQKNQEIEQKNQEIEQKNQEITDKNQEIEQKNQEIGNKNCQIEHFSEIERQYEAILNSISWRMVSRVCKTYDKIFHKGRESNVKTYFIKKYIGAFNMTNIKYVCNAFRIGGIRQVRKELRGFQQRITIGVQPEIPQLFKEEKIDDIDQYNKLIFKKYDDPQVSIIIPVYNQFIYTYNCLKAILENSGDISYEIIIADDASNDLTVRLSEITENIRIIRNDKNQMFLRNCNNATKYANGKYILFLNNDTQVQKDWLAPLVNLIESDDLIGMVGSKLIYPDGTLQEAGGIVWGDGHAWNYGNGQNANEPQFNYIKEADYISGASIMIRANLWKEIGGFDDRFAPAYYEDTDLAFEVRKHGYRLMYQPLSVVVHFEGKSNGTDIDTGIKKYQVENAEKFTDKWKVELRQQSQTEDDLFHARDRSQNKKTILVVDHYVPQYDKDAGGKCTYMYLKMFVRMGLKVTFIGDNFYKSEPYTTELNQLGIEVLYGNYYYNNWQTWLQDHGKYFDYIYLQRPHISIKYIDLVKKYSNAKIFYFAHDLHHLRERRQYELTGDEKILKSSEKWKKIEYELFGKANVGHVVGSYEQKLMQDVFPDTPIRNIPLYIYENVLSDINKDFSTRNDIIYVGGFGHPPNIDAVLWFANNIFPLIVKEIPNIKWHIVGSKPPKEVMDLSDENIIVEGFVSDERLAAMYRECRMAVVPLRVGAGVKGKVVEAAYYQIPLVTTPIGAEGISLEENAFEVVECNESMAMKIVRLYNDFQRLRELSDNSILLIKNHYTVDAAYRVLEMDIN